MKLLSIAMFVLLPNYMYAPPQVSSEYTTPQVIHLDINKGCTHGAIDSLARVIYAEVGHQPMETRLMVGRSIWNRAWHKDKPIAVIMNSKKQYNVIGSKKYYSNPNIQSRMAAWYCHLHMCKAHYFMNPTITSKHRQVWFYQQHFEKRIKDVAFFYPKH
jgi:spore germination cell wall hydrolase CwlJ-like protein